MSFSFIGEAMAAAVKAGVDIDPQVSNLEITVGFLVILLCGSIGSVSGYVYVYKKKWYGWFVFMGHMFLSMVAGLISFLMCFISGWFSLLGAKELVYLSFSKTALTILVICFVGTDALSILRRFIKDNLLAFLEKILKAFERKA